MDENLIYLNERQYKIVEIVVNSREILIDELSARLQTKQEDLMRDLAELESKGLLKVNRIVEQLPLLTDEGEGAVISGLPEERVHRVMYRCIEKPVAGFIECVSRELGDPPARVKIGLQHLLRHGCLRVREGKVTIGDEEKCFRALEEAAWLRRFLRNIGLSISFTVSESDLLGFAKRRRLVRVERRKKIIISATPFLEEAWRKNLLTTKELLTVVRPASRDTLSKYIIKRFDLSIPPPRPKGSWLNSYMEFLDLVRDILVSMGFEEAKGPHVELEFWNFDALFQAQDHPARDIHDTFFVKTDFQGKVPRELLERAGRVHREGWGYEWNPLKALKPMLRSQTTAVSVRSIFERGEGEYRVFSLDRVFRPETLDARHAMEFYQLDGIIVGKNIGFRDLLAFFKEFSAALGIRKVWFKPAYFPFTEPSVEGFIRHPKLGWIEVYPGGVFRREVMKILGAENVRAIAWGIGIDRLAMSVLGLDDIRDLFTRDLDKLEKMPTPILPYFTGKTSGRDIIVVEKPG